MPDLNLDRRALWISRQVLYQPNCLWTSLTITFLPIKKTWLNDLRPWISPSPSFPWEERDWLTCQFQGLSWQLDGRNNDRPDWDSSGAPWNSYHFIIQTGLTITNARVLHMYYFNNILLIVWNVVWMHVWDKSCNIQY